MEAAQSAPQTVDAYIAGFPDHVQEILQKIRTTVRNAAPEAEESISYQIPAFKLKGTPLVYFAAHKKHIGLYPVPVGNPELEELSEYASGKGTAQFPLNQPIPFDLIKKIVKFRAKDCLERAEAKRKKK
ncbi:MAG TPA: DUF1801 domain-containing protein [Longimicrobium sp.]|nr:DUF1801 domain-containing protein [Longimicrobium sp.]